VILRREDVARDPAHIRTEQRERLDKDASLNRHVQAAHDAGASERLLTFVALADCHQAGHLAFGQTQLFATELRQIEISHLVWNTARLLGELVCVRSDYCCCHFVLLVNSRRVYKARPALRLSSIA
jgi:hypothetical protein